MELESGDDRKSEMRESMRAVRWILRPDFNLVAKLVLEFFKLSDLPASAG